VDRKKKNEMITANGALVFGIKMAHELELRVSPFLAHKLLFSFAAMAFPIFLSLSVLYAAGAAFVIRCVRQAPRGNETEAGFEFEREDSAGKGGNVAPTPSKPRFWTSPRAGDGDSISGEIPVPRGDFSAQTLEEPVAQPRE
jgi:hypothetical protein